MVQVNALHYGSIAHYLGFEVPQEELIWQDNMPSANPKLIDGSEIAELNYIVSKGGLATGHFFISKSFCFDFIRLPFENSS